MKLYLSCIGYIHFFFFTKKKMRLDVFKQYWHPKLKYSSTVARSYTVSIHLFASVLCFFSHSVAPESNFFLHVFPGHSVGHRRPHDMEKAHAATGKRHGCIDYKAIKLKSNSKRNPLNLISRVQPRSMESPTVSIHWSALRQLEGNKSTVNRDFFRILQ